MEKQDILALSRKENQGKYDERELAAFGTASKVGMLIGGILCVILVLLSKFLFHLPAIGLVAWLVYFAMHGSHYISLYAQLGARHRLVLGIVYLIFAAVFAVALCAITLW